MLKHSVVFFSLLFSCFSFSQEKLTLPIQSYYIPGLVEGSETGRFIEILDLIEELENVEFEVTIAPTRRVQIDFSIGSTFGYFPELEENRPQQGNCRTSAFMQKQIVAFVRKGEPLVSNVYELEGKDVGGVSGYSYGLEIVNNPNIDLQLVSDDKANIKKLLSGRIDVIIGDLHSTVNALKETSNYDKVEFDSKNAVSHLDVFFLFQDTKKGQRACELVSNGIDKLRKQGELHTRFGYQ